MKALPNRLFIVLVALILLGIAVIRVPYFKSNYSRNYRKSLLTQLETDLKNDTYTAEKYWEFRERFSPGTFIRDEDHTGFFATFRITAVQTEGITPLFFYEAKHLRSLDGLVSIDSDVIKNNKEEFKGEVLYDSTERILIKVNETEYIFVFLEPIETMQAVNGMFDYKSSEEELLQNKEWYNATYISL